MGQTDSKSWRLNRQISLAVLIQLVFLASLIVGSWINLQRQLDLLQRDVTYLCQCQEDFQAKLESLSAKSTSYEYRLRALEKYIPEADIADERFLNTVLKEKSNEKDVGGSSGFLFFGSRMREFALCTD
ncbi:MAG: hypothetical protein ACYS0I_09780 [Planctomycetota bacterium]|jgi:hypothetical protein